MLVRNLLIAASFAALASNGCVGEFDGNDTTPGPDPDPDPVAGEAREMFDAEVAPILLANCSGEACHAGAATQPLKFLGDGSTTMDVYNIITAYPSVTGGFEAGLASVINRVDPGPHTPAIAGYQPGQVEIVSNWLQQELAERGADALPENPDTINDSRTALMTFVGCMTLANWDQANMGDFSDKGSGDGSCRNCHNDGLARFNTNNDNETMFQYNRYEVFSIGFFTTRVDPSTGNAMVIPAHDKIDLMCDGGGAGGIHPTCTYNPENEDYQNLQEFYDLTMAAMAAGQCGPAQFAVPPPPQ